MSETATTPFAKRCSAMDLNEYISPKRICSAADVLTTKDSGLDSNGIYGFWLPELPEVPITGCRSFDRWHLQYVGIAAGQSLRSRLVKHLTQSASVSTLRMSVGCVQQRPLMIAGYTSPLCQDIFSGCIS